MGFFGEREPEPDGIALVPTGIDFHNHMYYLRLGGSSSVQFGQPAQKYARVAELAYAQD